MNVVDKISLRASVSSLTSCEPPINWSDMTQEQQNEWLYANRLSSFEYHTDEDFQASVKTQADTIKLAIKAVLNELKERMIEATISCDLPSDFNEVDFHAILGME